MEWIDSCGVAQRCEVTDNFVEFNCDVTELSFQGRKVRRIEAVVRKVKRSLNGFNREQTFLGTKVQI